MASAKEDLSKLRTSELQERLESRNLDSSGRKAELVERLWDAMLAEGSVVQRGCGESSQEVVASGMDSSSNPQLLLTKLRLLREKQSLDEERVRIKARAEQDQIRVQARSEQLDLELKLAELGHTDESLLQPLRVKVDREQRDTVQGPSTVVGAQFQRALLPPTEITPFSGDVEQFRLFMKAFDTRIATKTQDEGELLFFLHQYLVGTPKLLVSSCLHMGEGGYQAARRLLEERYGSRFALIDRLLGKLRAWPRVPQSDIEALDRFQIFLVEIENIMSDVEMSEFQHPRTLRDVMEKLPGYLVNRWLQRVDELNQSGRMATFSDMVQLVSTEVRIKKSPVYGVRAPETRQSQGGGVVMRQHRVNAVSVNPQTGPPGCMYCRGSHFLGECEKLRWLSYDDRRRFLMSQRLCFGCLKLGHRIGTCRRPLTCRVCGGPHCSLMHRGAPSPYQHAGAGSAQSTERQPGRSASEARPTEVRASSGSSGAAVGSQVVSAGVSMRGESGRTMMPVVSVRLRTKFGTELVTNAFLDQGSSGCFITKRMACQLDLNPQTTSISIDTVTSEGQKVKTSLVEGVEIAALGGGVFHKLPPLFTLDNLPITQEDRCNQAQASRWEHLADVRLDQLSSDVDIMVGGNVPHLLAPLEVRSPPAGVPGPVGFKTPLGWFVLGCPGDVSSCDSRLLVNFIRCQEAGRAEPDPCSELYQKYYQKEFQDLSDDREGFSVEDREWLSQVKSSIKKDEEGHYEVAIPKIEVDRLPDSYPTALSRLSSLRKRFKRDPAYFEAYKKVINALVEDGYAVPVSEQEASCGLTWVLPHHGVVEEGKGKIRVVFDCASKTDGIRLNDVLKRGPVLSTPLLDVLCRFREGRIAFTCDIKAMYLRVHVPLADSQLFRFLWFKDDDLDGDIKLWRMRSHVFGAVSSGSIASYALRHCAEEGRERFPEAADALLRRVYVDDGLLARDSVDEAVQLAQDLKQLCKMGEFEMTKFTSNSVEFLKQIDVDDRGKNVKNIDLDRDRLSSERALGLKWDVEDDMFTFEFKPPTGPPTRRVILATVAGVFDPLGIVSPVTVLGRVLLQRLCARSQGWDDPLPPEFVEDWERWKEMGAKKLVMVKLSRCISGPPGEVLDAQLHVFADASEKAYAGVAFLRKTIRGPGGDPEVFVTFLAGKARVNPVRFVSIPRLELAAAVLAVKLKVLLVRELDTKFDSIHLWTDSMVVLMYIRNRTTRFKTYVANRLDFIHSGSEVSEWSYVPSKDNPADIGSRGAAPDKLGMWLEGPDFLHRESPDWPEEPGVQAAIPDCEVKRSSAVMLTAVKASPESPVGRLVGHFSSFSRLKRAVAWFRRFAAVLRDGTFRRWCLAKRKGLRSRDCGKNRGLTLSETCEAEHILFKYAQSDMPDLPSDRSLDGPVEVKCSSQLSKLRPFMRNGLLVVGGRIGESSGIPETTKHPIILPRKHPVTRLIIRHSHCMVGHEGRNHTLSKLSERFFVLGAGSEVKQMLRSCVTCKKVNARPQRQLMADLPAERVSPGTAAFGSIFLDVFGPIMVKSGRSERKRYGLMCVCSVTRGIHIEILNSLRTDSLINAIRRISARRGPIHQIHSDLGTNLVGAERELREALNGIDTDSLQRAALGQEIDWRFSPPTGSHFSGGVERQIRTFRKIWRSMPTQGCVDDESLYTLFCEIEAIMNSRPLTFVSTDMGEIEALTPNHLLLLREGAAPVPGQFSESDSFSRRKWRHVQYLAEQFWVRFKREFLPLLQSRQKWTRESRNLEKGDIVLLVDSVLPRGRWQMARVVEPILSRDGLIRKCVVRTSSTTYLRPIHKMVLVHSESDLKW